MKIRTQIILFLLFVLFLLTGSIGTIIIKNAADERKAYLQDLQLSYLVTLGQSFQEKVSQLKNYASSQEINNSVLKGIGVNKVEEVFLYTLPKYENNFTFEKTLDKFRFVFKDKDRFIQVHSKKSFFKNLYHSGAFEIFLWDGSEVFELGGPLSIAREELKSVLNNDGGEKLLTMSREFKNGNKSFMISVHRAIEHSNLYIVSYVSSNQLTTLIQKTITKLAPYFIVILLLVFFTGLFISKKMIGPINQLVKLSKDLSRGEWKKRIATNNSKSEVNQLAISFNEMSEELEKREVVIKQQERLSVLGQFSAGIAHEIKNPLNVIASYAQLLARNKSDQFDEQSKKYIEIIHNEVKRGSQIITDLMVYAKERDLKKESVSYLSFLGKLKENFSLMAAMANVHLEFKNDTQTSEIYADESSLFQVLTNLIENALHAFDGLEREKKYIEIVAERAKNHTIISVRDNGAGISKKHLEHLFEPFYTTKETGKGTGLGLSTCFGIIDRHDGTIEVDSKEGEGTIFRIKLPNKN